MLSIKLTNSVSDTVHLGLDFYYNLRVLAPQADDTLPLASANPPILVWPNQHHYCI